MHVFAEPGQIREEGEKAQVMQWGEIYYQVMPNHPKFLLCSITAWATGSCALGSIEGHAPFGYVGSLLKDIFPKFRRLMRSLPTRDHKFETDYAPRRWLISFSSSTMNANSFYQLIKDESEVLTSFENLAHDSSGVTLVLWTIK